MFNNDYDSGDYGPAYDRWDARSQAIITRTDYIRRHTECPSSPQAARVEDTSPGPGGAWLVDYEISGVQLRDYWFYVRGRWVFDLVPKWRVAARRAIWAGFSGSGEAHLKAFGFPGPAFPFGLMATSDDHEPSRPTSRYGSYG